MKTGRNLINLIFIILLAGADQLTKGLIVSFVKGRGNIVLIKGVLELEYFENFGAAFNSLVGQRILLIDDIHFYDVSAYPVFAMEIIPVAG